MVKVLLKVIVVVLFLILLSSRAYAISLGSVTKNNFAEISIDESAKFKMIFWNIDSEPYTVVMTVEEAPKDWIVIIDPDEFILNKSIGEEYIKLPYLSENIKAKVVNLFVKPDANSESGKYLVIIKAGVEVSKLGEDSLSIIPERLFKFEVDLNGMTNTKNNNVESIEFSGNDFGSGNGNLKNNSENLEYMGKEYFYLIVVFLVIATSGMIYKKS